MGSGLVPSYYPVYYNTYMNMVNGTVQ